MVENMKTAGMVWNTKNKVGIQAKGNMVLVSYVYNNREDGRSLQSAKPRCIWPTSIQRNDSRFLSRRVQAKA